jgi:dihydropteroate synthase
VLRIGERTLVMGILNVTPDSFYPDSRRASPHAAIAAGRRMLAAGADVIDVGGESTRPGAEPVSVGDELDRVCPVVEALARDGAAVSIDTSKAEVARAALAAGARMINDVTALRGDPQMKNVAAAAGVHVVLMHMRGTPRTMQQNPAYGDTIAEVSEELLAAVAEARAAGIRDDCIVLDPGIGFGKRPEDNLVLIRDIRRIRALGYPVLIGASRKSFLGAVTGRGVGDRLAATLAAHAVAVFAGADMVRVHDVAEAVDMARVVDAVRRGGLLC